jgi:flagellar protein FliJ
MSKFHFRLSTLLQLRETARDQRCSELAEAHRQDTDLEGRLRQIRDTQVRLKREGREAIGPGVVDVARLLKIEQYASSLKDQATAIAEQRSLLAVEIDRRRQALVQAERELQVLEKLRDNQSQQQRQEEHRQESKLLDEAALMARR